jgi:hypothetical protein
VITGGGNPCGSPLSTSSSPPRCVESGEPTRLFGVEPPKPRIQAVRIVDMCGSNAWAEFAGISARTRAAYLEHEQAKTELKDFSREPLRGSSRNQPERRYLVL